MSFNSLYAYYQTWLGWDFLFWFWFVLLFFLVLLLLLLLLVDFLLSKSYIMSLVPYQSLFNMRFSAIYLLQLAYLSFYLINDYEQPIIFFKSMIICYCFSYCVRAIFFQMNFCYCISSSQVYYLRCFFYFFHLFFCAFLLIGPYVSIYSCFLLIRYCQFFIQWPYIRYIFVGQIYTLLLVDFLEIILKLSLI